MSTKQSDKTTPQAAGAVKKASSVNSHDVIAEKFAATSSVKIKSMFSHLAASEDASETAFTESQLDQFKDIFVTPFEKDSTRHKIFQNRPDQILLKKYTRHNLQLSGSCQTICHQ